MVSLATAPGSGVGSPVTLVWIDARQAVIAHWVRDTVEIERIPGDLPPRDRSVGRMRHNPLIRQGGGQPQTRLDHRRQEAEHAYLDAVLSRVPTGGAVEVIGPGPIRHHLVRRLRDRPHAGTAGEVRTRPADQMTEAQIAARLRELAGHPPARQSVAR